MQRYLIERNIQGASELSHADLVEIARTSCKAVASLGVPYNWITSYVAGDKIYCLHEAEDAETIVEHARRGARARGCRRGSPPGARSRSCRRPRSW